MEFNGRRYNEVNEDIVGVTVQQTNRPLSPAHRSRVANILGRNGAYFFGKDREPKQLTLRFRVESGSQEEKQQAIRDISDWLDTPEPAPLIRDDEDDKKDMCILIGEVVPEHRGVYACYITATMVNYMSYSESVEAITWQSETYEETASIFTLPENFPSNGQVNAVVKGQTWVNLAGEGDDSPQTVENLDSNKTYLLVNSEDSTVNIDTVSTATPVKLTGATNFSFEWTEGKIALFELSETEAVESAEGLRKRYHYISGTKSTLFSSLIVAPPDVYVKWEEIAEKTFNEIT